MVVPKSRTIFFSSGLWYDGEKSVWTLLQTTFSGAEHFPHYFFTRLSAAKPTLLSLPYEAAIHVLAFSVELDGNGRALVSTIIRGMKEPCPHELRSRPPTGRTAVDMLVGESESSEPSLGS